MRLKFEKNKIHCRISQIEAQELLSVGFLTDKVNFPSGHVFTYRVELSELNENAIKYALNVLTYQMTREAVLSLAETPTKHGIIFLQDKAAYVFEVDIRKERRKKNRKI